MPNEPFYRSNEMKTGKFEYKCRRCGEIEVNPCTSEDNARLFLMCLLFGHNPPQSLMGTPPKIYSTHRCKDGGCGVSDLIGYRVVEEQ